MANGRIRRTVTGPFGVSYVEETKGSGKAAKPTVAASQRRPGVRWKVILGAILILSGLYGATADPTAGFEACAVGAALLGWAAWSRQKIKNQNRPVVEDTPAEPPEGKE